MKKNKSVMVRFPFEVFNQYATLLKRKGLSVSEIIRLGFYYYVDNFITADKALSNK
jgi:antitoxin component of RelBE/YafQ-DinJ toxin-antitoxin module